MQKCRLCGRTALEVKGWLKRMNKKGGVGIWECRPSCDTNISQEAAIIGALLEDASDYYKLDAHRKLCKECGCCNSHMCAIGQSLYNSIYP